MTNEQASARNVLETTTDLIQQILIKHETAVIAEFRTIIEAKNHELKLIYAERDRLLAQLPDGMKECTIVFKECVKGHGWLTAKNWVQHECQTCERDQEIARLMGEIDKANTKGHDAIRMVMDAEDRERRLKTRLGRALRAESNEPPQLPPLKDAETGE